MKKIFSLSIAFIFSMLLLVGCSKADVPSTSDKPLNKIKAGTFIKIAVEDVKGIELISLENKKIMDFSKEDINKIVNSYNNSTISDMAYVAMLAGISMKIILVDNVINISSYGSETNIITSGVKSDFNYHLVCPEIAKILLSK